MLLGAVCRTCLCSGRAMCSLFDRKPTESAPTQIALVDQLKMFTELTISYNDGFPDQICVDCIDEIQRMYSFKLKCESSEVTLKQWKCDKRNSDKSKNIPNKFEDSSEKNSVSLKEMDYKCSEIKSDYEENNEFSVKQHSEVASVTVSTEENAVIGKYEEFAVDSEQSSKMLSGNISFRGQTKTNYLFENIKEEPELDIASTEEISTEDENEEQNSEKNAAKSSLESLECPSCLKEYSTREQLKNHVIAIHMDGKLCKICTKEFDDPSQHLTEHLSSESNSERDTIKKKNSNRPFKCKICWDRFPYRFGLKNHMRITHKIFESEDENYFQCDICCRIFERKCNLRRHARNHTNETPFKCSICSQAFRQYYNLTHHMTEKHPDILNKNNFQCKVCSKIFEHKSYLVRHEKSHTDERPFKCEFCSKTFRHKNNLKGHIQEKHATVKKSTKDDFQCEVCSKKFQQEADLIVHFRCHSNERPFKCEICSTKFQRRDQLTVHMKMKHDIDSNNLQCEICSKIFAHRSNLIRHSRMHTDERPFICTICSQAFRYKNNLEGHMVKHRVENKNNKCHICSLVLVRKSDLTKHIKRMHGQQKDIEKKTV